MFKKIISLVLCFAIILSALPITGIAATMEDFVIDENGVLVKYNGAGSKLRGANLPLAKVPGTPRFLSKLSIS